jgi:hypothetical protein
MAFDWRDFLKLAQAMLVEAKAGTLGPPEAAYRTIVGRAYYAAFGYAHDYAVQWLKFQPRKKPEEKSQDHGRLKAHFRSKRRNAVAEGLIKLRDLRNDCDYLADIPDVDLSRLATGAITVSNYVISALPQPKTT